MFSDSPWLSLLGMIVVMAAIIALAYWFTRYVVGGNQMRAFGLLQKNDQLQVLAQTPIGKDQRLAVIRAGTRYFVVGITAQNISMLAELSEDEAALWQERQSEKGRAPAPAFQQAFMDALQKRKKR